MFPPIDQSLAADLAGLTPEQLAEVAVFARKLRARREAAEADRSGTPGAQLLRFAGVLSASEAVQMMQDIEEGCGQINHADW